MAFKNQLFIALSLCAVTTTIHPELLIIKKVKDKDGEEVFAPLDVNDKADNAAAPIIAAILLKYQWPMVIASDLTESEKNELLTPIDPKEIEKLGKTFPEEEFIQKKIRETLKGKGDNYFVIFVPTALYELFCINLLFKTAGDNQPLERAAQLSEKQGYVDIANIINEEGLGADIQQAVFNAYGDFNNIFFKKKAEDNAFFYVNASLGEFLLKIYPALKTDQDGQEISEALQSALDDIVFRLVNEILDMYDNVKQREKIESGKREVNKKIIEQLIKNLKKERAQQLIIKIEELEYEARSLNKAMLLRGTSFEKMQVCFGTKEERLLIESPKEKTLAGSTIFLSGESVEEEYGNKTIDPYSISFGSSLFAGALFDLDACAFNYLSGYRSERTIKKVTGYALFVDKKSYVEHQNQNLFFIPPLAPIAALFQENEFFHPRSKAAILLKETEPVDVCGIAAAPLKDPMGILLITRDPLKHAELFSNFLANNGRIINIEDARSLKEADFEEVIKNQAEAAEFYRNVRKVAPIMRKATKRRRESLIKKKDAAQAVKQLKIEDKLK